MKKKEKTVGFVPTLIHLKAKCNFWVRFPYKNERSPLVEYWKSMKLLRI